MKDRLSFNEKKHIIRFLPVSYKPIVLKTGTYFIKIFRKKEAVYEIKSEQKYTFVS